MPEEISDLDNFYSAKEEPVQSCLLALRNIILSHNFKEVWKYKSPFFTWNNKSVCYLWIDKKTQFPYIGFIAGKLLDDPALIQESRKIIKILPINPNEDIPIKKIDALFNKLLLYYKQLPHITQKKY